MKRKIVILLLSIPFLFSCCSGKKTTETTVNKPNKEHTLTDNDFTRYHIFDATFSKTKYHKCMGMTADCPDKCGNSGEYANFEITRYKKFDGKGEGGSQKLETYQKQISDFNKKRFNDESVRIIESLKPGDQVEIQVNYIYDTRLTTVQTVENLISIRKL
ncbi:MAG: hypothetical protein N4A45_08310 [Flavobacteriales bacterium]|jgi:Pyruvate/2-oxoacid:ferredoxin oxidoreductase delta subunit|nr:hypothetical protein [Flavobacteriales bacterium]